MKSEADLVKLGDLITYKKGFAFKSKNYTTSGVPVIRVTNFTSDSIDISDIRYVDNNVARVNRNVELIIGDVVIATVGSWPSNPASVVGKTIRVPEIANGSLLNQNAVRIRVVEGQLNQSFLFYLLKSQQFCSYIVSSAQGSANQASITLDDIFSFKFLCWPLPTQKTIAHILSTLDDKIELNRKMNQTLESMAQAIFKSWFVDFDPVHAKAGANSEYELNKAAKDLGISREVLDLFPSEFEESELGLIPKGWEVNSIYDVAEVIYGAPFSSKYFNSYQLGKPLIRIRDLKTFNSQHWTEEVHVKGTLIKAGDLLIGMDAEFTPTIWQGVDGWLNQRVCKIEPIKGTYTAFHYFALESKMKFFEQANVGTTVIHLGKKDIDTIKLVIPDDKLLEQSKLILRPMFQQLVQNSNNNRSLQKTRDTLLPKLLSGELDVSNLNLGLTDD